MGQVIEFTRTSKTGKLPPRGIPNQDLRSRECLAPAELEALVAAAKAAGRHGHRDATLVLMTYQHAGWVAEVITWRRDQIDLGQGVFNVNRAKNGNPSVHPLRGPEIRELWRLFRGCTDSPYVYSTERKAPLTDSAVRKIVAREGN